MKNRKEKKEKEEKKEKTFQIPGRAPLPHSIYPHES